MSMAGWGPYLYLHSSELGRDFDAKIALPSGEGVDEWGPMINLQPHPFTPSESTYLDSGDLQQLMTSIPASDRSEIAHWASISR